MVWIREWIVNGYQMLTCSYDKNEQRHIIILYQLFRIVFKNINSNWHINIKLLPIQITRNTGRIIYILHIIQIV